MAQEHLDTILTILRDVAGLDSVDPDQDYYDAGMTSVQALPLLLELEDQFGVSIPDDSFIQARSARALSALITGLPKTPSQ
jgi:acyl carrier protein